MVETNMQRANLDFENDELAYKINSKNDKIKIFSEQITKLEIELVKSKQDLGEALNTVYEYEQTAADRELMVTNNMTIKGNNTGNSHGDNDDSGDLSSESRRKRDDFDGGSGSTVKKLSKKDKLKNFFLKNNK